MSLDGLAARGFDVAFHGHARAILGVDFPEALAELEEALSQATVPIEEIIASGGGEAKGTQRLRRALAARGWLKQKFTVEKRINGEPREISSASVDALLAELDYEGTHFAVAVNYDVLPKSRWAETRLKTGDEIEIITPRQGG